MPACAGIFGKGVAFVRLMFQNALMAVHVYMLASQKNGTLYTGHTDNLPHRILDHREGRSAAFTRRYRVHRLVWFEAHESREDAKRREYQIKSWRRAWKRRLIEEANPDWDNLYLKLNMLV